MFSSGGIISAPCSDVADPAEETKKLGEAAKVQAPRDALDVVQLDMERRDLASKELKSAIAEWSHDGVLLASFGPVQQTGRDLGQAPPSFRYDVGIP